MIEYHAWAIVNGALESDETFETEAARDVYASTLAETLRTDGVRDWQVHVANVTGGCAVGEWADETADCMASSVA